MLSSRVLLLLLVLRGLQFTRERSQGPVGRGGSRFASSDYCESGHPDQPSKALTIQSQCDGEVFFQTIFNGSRHGVTDQGGFFFPTDNPVEVRARNMYFVHGNSSSLV